MKILILHEKNSNRYFSVRDDAQLYNICVSILKERLKEGCWYIAEEPELLGLTKEQIDALPKGSIKTEALEIYENYKTLYDEYLSEKKFIEEVRKAIKVSFNSAIKEAYKRIYPFYLLQRRNSYDYEGIELETIIEVI